MPLQLHNRSAWLLLFAIQIVNGCGLTTPGTDNYIDNNALKHPQLTASCEIRQLAFDKTLEYENVIRASIIAGCEGPYKSYIVSLDEREKISSNNVLPPPQSVLSGGIRYEKLYQQLIMHGVPEVVLLKIVDSKEFIAAATEIPSQRVM